MKYIDAEKLKAEIEKRLKNVRDYINGAGVKYKSPKYYKAQGKESAYDALLSVITSAQQKQQGVDLEEEIDRYCEPIQAWQVQEAPFTSLENCAHHFYELGLNARKEE